MNPAYRYTAGRCIAAAVVLAALCWVRASGAETIGQIYPDTEDADDILICDDLDEDGILDVLDNCADHFNPQQTDDNHNGIGDACE